MKKRVSGFLFLVISAVLSLAVSSVFAGGIENKPNLSVEWIRTLNRNAATDAADAVVYNPAGVMRMENGAYVNASGQYAVKTYSNTYRGVAYEDDEPNMIPSLFGLYKRDKWAAFAAFTIPCGGGKVDYERGSTTTFLLGQRVIATSGGLFNAIKAQRMEGESSYYGYTFGGAVDVDQRLSFSLALRYVDAQRERKGFATLTGPGGEKTFEVDYEETASGWGGILGINLSPTDRWNIGLRLETKTKLELETKVNRDDMGLLAQGAKLNRDFPGVIAFGTGFQIMPDLKAEVDFTYYLNAMAEWDDLILSSGNERRKNNGYDMGFALEYAFSPRWKGSAGFMYTETGMEPQNMSVEQPELDAVTLAAGAVYEIRPGLSLNVGLCRSFYSDETTSAGVKLEKKVLISAIGIQYKFK